MPNRSRSTANLVSTIIGVNTAGGSVGVGASILDFRGAGISTITVASGIATINITGGTSTDGLTASIDLLEVMLFS
jgi:hypothetical protein